MTDNRERWALILGASSGMGEATARALAKAGYKIAGIHLDFRAGLAHVDEVKAAIEAADSEALYINMNAADDEKRAGALEQLRERGLRRRIRVHQQHAHARRAPPPPPNAYEVVDPPAIARSSFVVTGLRKEDFSFAATQSLIVHEAPWQRILVARVCEKTREIGQRSLRIQRVTRFHELSPLMATSLQLAEPHDT